MRRVLGHLFTIIAGTSLLLCMASCVLWVWSYKHKPALIYHSPEGQRSIQLSAGFVCVVDLSVKNSPSFDPNRPGWKWTDLGGEPDRFESFRRDAQVGLSPFFWIKTTSWSGGNFVQRVLVTPIWGIAVACIPVPVVWFAQYRRQRARQRSALCATCGYDLRASPDRCPECGAANAVAVR